MKWSKKGEKSQRIFKSMKGIIKFNTFFSLMILLGLPFEMAGQDNGGITGKVVDSETGEALPAVNVMIEGTVLGTSTDLEGNFKLQNIYLVLIIYITFSIMSTIILFL